MKVTSRTWFAVVGPDGTYGEPQPFEDALELPLEIPGVETNRFATLLIDSSHGLSGSLVTVCDELILNQKLWRKLGLGQPYRIWELRKRGKRSHKNRRKGNR